MGRLCPGQILMVQVCPVDYKTARERITLLLYLPQYLTTQRVLILFLSKSPDIHTLCTGAPSVLHPKCYNTPPSSVLQHYVA